MGKNIISQRRGRGSSTYKAPSFRYIGKVIHRIYDEIEKNGVIEGKVMDIINCPGHSAPLAIVKYYNGDTSVIFAPNGLYTGQIISSGQKSQVRLGNTLPLKNIPVGTLVGNIESKMGDGGKFARSAGSFGRIVSKTNEIITIKFPSKKQRNFNPGCRAVVGILAGAGRKEKPILKAGKMYRIMRARNKLYPLTSGVAMNAVDHPFGSGRGRHVGKPKTPKKNAPPGRNVGAIRARRTGWKR